MAISHSPSELEIPISNADFEILIEWGSKVDVLHFMFITEESFCRLVEALGYVV